MSKRTALIVDALRKRLRDVSATAKSINPEEFRESSRDVERLRQVVVQGTFEPILQPLQWSVADDDCLTCLKRLSVGETIDAKPATPPVEDFLALLKSTAQDPRARFDLLTNRYAFPLNFALSSEEEIREHLLSRIMVQARARLERHSVTAGDADDLLLSLNLLAINSLFTNDLRYLDALNYFYELLFGEMRSKSKTGWLSVSFLPLYARALDVVRERLSRTMLSL